MLFTGYPPVLEGVSMPVEDDRVRLLAQVAKQVQQRFFGFADRAHGWEHVRRVFSLAISLAHQEHANSFIVGMAALLHDLGRTLHDPARPHAQRSALLASEILEAYHLSADEREAITHAILAHSYKQQVEPRTLEARVVYDADRLDSLGASGILRWAMSGALEPAQQVQTYHPEDPFAQHRSLNERRYLLDRFYTKLLNLPERMKTPSGRTLAEQRVQVLRLYLKELEQELALQNPAWLQQGEGVS
jgi:uncharacterized protein